MQCIESGRARTFAVCLLALIVAAGCSKGGPDVAPVRGKVTLDGKPLADVVVQFQPEDSKRPSGGGTDENGEYELYYKKGVVGARVGHHIVRIMPPTGPNAPIIPDRYNKQTELRAEVKAGQNEINFDLKSEAK